jgi:hypothetical protein
MFIWLGDIRRSERRNGNRRNHFCIDVISNPEEDNRVLNAIDGRAGSDRYGRYEAHPASQTVSGSNIKSRSSQKPSPVFLENINYKQI